MRKMKDLFNAAKGGFGGLAPVPDLAELVLLAAELAGPRQVKKLLRGQSLAGFDAALPLFLMQNAKGALEPVRAEAAARRADIRRRENLGEKVRLGEAMSLGMLDGEAGDIARNYTKALGYVLAAGGDTNAAGGGDTNAAGGGDTNAAGGGDTNAAGGGGGETALMLASAAGLERAVDMLLEKGADRAARDAAGKTAYDYACAGGFEKIAQKLRPRGRPSSSPQL